MTCHSDRGTFGTLCGTVKKRQRTPIKPYFSTFPADWYVWYVKIIHTHIYNISL